MAEQYVLLKTELVCPSDSTTTIAAQVTDLTGPLQSIGLPVPQCSKSLSIKDLFDPGLFLANESIIDRTESQYGMLNSPPRIGIPPARQGYWAEQQSENPLGSEWALVFGDPKDSESSARKCPEVEPVSPLPIQQSQTDKLATVGAGLHNLGNTCFMNAVLQCFLHTVPLVHDVLSDVRGNCGIRKFCSLCAFRELIDLSFTTKSKWVSPSKFISHLSEFSNSFISGRQEDAHEFLQCFLDKLGNCYGEKGGHSKSENLVKKVFHGGLISKLTCMNCGYRSDTRDPSLDLSLEIENADNLIRAIQSFTRIEKIEDPDNNVNCKGCKEKAPAEKQLSFTKIPSVAMFHLKRFKNNGTSVEKIDKHVAFPLELDLVPFIVSGEPTDVEHKYMLYAVIVHSGNNISYGHYYCFIRLAPNVWYRFNDADAVQVHEDHVLLEEAYILFYAKQGTSWFTSFIDTLPDKQVLLPITETSPLPPQLRKSESSDASVVGNLDNLQLIAVSHCESDSSDEAVLNPVCPIQFDLASCKRSLEKLIDDSETEMLKLQVIASSLTPHQDNGSRKKSRNDDT